MIDCSKTKNYFAEKLRMTKKHKLTDGTCICELNCDDCPLSSSNNGSSDMMSCSDFQTIYPQEAIKIVQKWSDEHPEQTLLTAFNSYYPQATKGENGIPHICLAKLGKVNYCNELFNPSSKRCEECWNTPVE